MSLRGPGFICSSGLPGPPTGSQSVVRMLPKRKMSFHPGRTYVGIASVGDLFVQVQSHCIHGGALRAPDCGGVRIGNRHELVTIEGNRVNQEKLVLDCLEDEHVWPQHCSHEPDVAVHESSIFVNVVGQAKAHIRLYDDATVCTGSRICGQTAALSECCGCMRKV